MSLSCPQSLQEAHAPTGSHGLSGGEINGNVRALGSDTRSCLGREFQDAAFQPAQVQRSLHRAPYAQECLTNGPHAHKNGYELQEGAKPRQSRGLTNAHRGCPRGRDARWLVKCEHLPGNGIQGAGYLPHAPNGGRRTSKLVDDELFKSNVST
jgi:hypothetical protein